VSILQNGKDTNEIWMKGRSLSEIESLFADSKSPILLRLTTPGTDSQLSQRVATLRRSQASEDSEWIHGKLISVTPFVETYEFLGSDTNVIGISPAVVSKWKRVAIGDSIDSVKSQLGEGVRQFSDGTFQTIIFGRVPFDSTSPIKFLELRMHFEKGVLVSKEDPFNGELSSDGIPSTPTLLTPADGAQFNYIPRIHDLRWLPSSGSYPIEYQVEISFDLGNQGATYVAKTMDCKLTIEVPGMNRARWRVRGANATGVGDWSAQRYFEFAQ